ncbi:zinc-dependent alcohol dehydrogenase family protein [Bacillus sp. B1-b2]|uniref:zinc-dependent alcohol dehydrogenase family protein n=1 Tax=Bacillus sp. B1-b2 TaxID=2653201 RepID=UPI00126140DB|nr:zinc-dependent alcohol dehydrogenase family protein [Bacillus sp. B1-b2]KAB7666438.1 zinc-dependent alcohol dehydrogenase family protein [Bacillus sp. B1-b2]
MKAMIIEGFGEASEFILKEIEKPSLKPNHVLIEVAATSVNPIDIKVRSGAVPAAAPCLPAVLHGDVAGVVAEVGEGVKDFCVGDEVFGCAGGFKGTGGALAEYMLADVRLLAKKPKNLTMEEAAALPLVGITAWEALFERGKLKSTDRILIHGGTGGVGHIAIQLARYAGADIYTTVSSGEKGQIAKKLGANFILNYKEEKVEEYVQKYTNGEGFPIVFDTIGGDNLDKSFQAASINGTVLNIAARSTHDLSPLHAKGLSLHVTFMLLKILNESKRDNHGAILKELSVIAEDNKLKPLIDKRVFTIEEVAKAHDYLASGSAVGKVVLVNKW